MKSYKNKTFYFLALLLPLLASNNSLGNLSPGGIATKCTRGFATTVRDAETLVRQIEKNKAAHSKDPARMPIAINTASSTVAVMFESDVLTRILQKGFKNFHSMGSNSFFEEGGPGFQQYQSKRRLLENIITGKNPDLYPVYGFLNVMDPRFYNKLTCHGFDGMEDANDKGHARYGDMVAILKNRIKKRSTFTLFDTLNYFGRGDSLLKEGTLKARNKVRQKLNTFTNPEVEVDFADLSEEYVEVQIYGAFRKSDIDYLIIDPTWSDWSRRKSKSIARIAADFGIEVYERIPHWTPMNEVFSRKEIEPLMKRDVGYSNPEDDPGKVIGSWNLWLPGKKVSPD